MVTAEKESEAIVLRRYTHLKELLSGEKITVVPMVDLLWARTSLQQGSTELVKTLTIRIRVPTYTLDLEFGVRTEERVCDALAARIADDLQNLQSPLVELLQKAGVQKCILQRWTSLHQSDAVSKAPPIPTQEFVLL